MKNKTKIIIYFCLAIIGFTAIMVYIRMVNDRDLRRNTVKEWSRYYVVKTKNCAYINSSPQKKKDIVFSEAQGYGMLIAASHHFANHEEFDRLYYYYLDHRDKETQLMSWRQTKKKGKWYIEHNSETKGDMLIAYALLKASEEWPERTEYKQQALRIMHDILHDEYNPQTGCLTVGNWADERSKMRNLLKTSTISPKIFDKFYQVSGNGQWMDIKASMLQKLSCLSKEHKSGLIPDYAWVNKNNAYPIKGRVTINYYDSYYSSNACRMPMILADSHEQQSQKALRKMLKFFGKQRTIYGGYTLKGHPLSNYQSACFGAPILVAVDRNRAKGYDNLYISQQYVLTRPLARDNYNDAVTTTLAAIMTEA